MIALFYGETPQKRSTPWTANLTGHATNQRSETYHPWQNEARRLAGEYLTTGRETHRQAFERHMGAILQQMRRAL